MWENRESERSNLVVVWKHEDEEVCGLEGGERGDLLAAEGCSV